MNIRFIFVFIVSLSSSLLLAQSRATYWIPLFYIEAKCNNMPDSVAEQYINPIVCLKVEDTNYYGWLYANEDYRKLRKVKCNNSLAEYTNFSGLLNYKYFDKSLCNKYRLYYLDKDDTSMKIVYLHNASVDTLTLVSAYKGYKLEECATVRRKLNLIGKYTISIKGTNNRYTCSLAINGVVTNNLLWDSFSTKPLNSIKIGEQTKFLNYQENGVIHFYNNQKQVATFFYLKQNEYQINIYPAIYAMRQPKLGHLYATMTKVRADNLK